MDKPVSDAALREYCDRIIDEKVHQEKVQQEKLKAVKARLNFEEVSQHSKSGTPSKRKDLRMRLGSRHVRSMSGSPEPRRGRPESPRKKDPERKIVFKRLEKVVFHRLRDKGKTPALEEQCLPLGNIIVNTNIITKEHPHTRRKLCRKAKVVQDDTGSQGQKGKGQALKMTIYPSHGAAAKVERMGCPMVPHVQFHTCRIRQVKIGDEEHSTSAWMNFVVVRSSSPYNGIIRRPGVRKIQAVPSTAHGMIKFPVAGGVLTLKSSKIIPIECAAVSGPEGQPSNAHQAIKERIKEGCLPVRQNRRSQAADRNQAIQEEVEKLIDAGIMKEVHYHNWLSNPVMVKKHDDSWRMCVDFKDLNKAYPKDGYPLPEIDWKVESLYGFPFKCFLYKGYHQIKMAKEDEEKTTFIT
ncbi:hypothetical protein Tco_0934683 [Tanacetum coccineum]